LDSLARGRGNQEPRPRSARRKWRWVIAGWAWYIIGPLVLGPLYLLLGTYAYLFDNENEETKKKLIVGMVISVLMSIGLYNIIRSTQSESSLMNTSSSVPAVPLPSSGPNSFTCSDPQLVHAVKESLLNIRVPAPHGTFPMIMPFILDKEEPIYFGKKLDEQIANTPELKALSPEDAMNWVREQFEELYKMRMEKEHFTNIITETKTDNLLVCHLQWVSMKWPTMQGTRPTPFDGFRDQAKELASHIDYQVQFFDDHEHYRVTVDGVLIRQLRKTLYGQ
jgi:hypothetical protein